MRECLRVSFSSLSFSLHEQDFSSSGHEQRFRSSLPPLEAPLRFCGTNEWQEKPVTAKGQEKVGPKILSFSWPSGGPACSDVLVFRYWSVLERSGKLLGISAER